MEIINYKKTKSNLYEVEFDDGKKYKIYDDIILKYELLIYKNVKKDKLDKILKENEVIDAYFKGLKYIGIKMRTKKEIREYFKKYDISKEASEYAIKRLENEGLIDNEKYADAYIKDSITLSNSGPKKIEDNLKKLGINDEIITKYLNRIDESIWLERITKILTKKAKTNKNSASIFKNKMYTHLLTIGYNTDQINITLNDFNINTEDAFKKEADKVYSLLEKKYKDNELKYKFKNKMFQKGYKTDEINSYLEEK